MGPRGGYPNLTSHPAVEMKVTVSDADTELGREVVRNGQLQVLRERLGLTRNAMAELLYISAFTYSNWERRHTVELWPGTAQRVGRFYRIATTQLQVLEESGVTLTNLIPFHLVATKLGLPQELLLRMYRDGEVDAVEAGILGLWVEQAELARLRG